MWISVLWHSRFHCPGIVLLGTQKYDIEAYTGTILNFFQKKLDFDYLTLRLITLEPIFTIGIRELKSSDNLFYNFWVRMFFF